MRCVLIIALVLQLYRFTKVASLPNHEMILIFSHSLHFVSDAVRQSGFSNITGHIILSELLS